jgi:hypothetical protein
MNRLSTICSGVDKKYTQGIEIVDKIKQYIDKSGAF